MTLATLIYLGPIAAVVVMAAMIPLFFWMLNKYAPAQTSSQPEALVEAEPDPKLEVLDVELSSSPAMSQFVAGRRGANRQEALRFFDPSAAHFHSWATSSLKGSSVLYVPIIGGLIKRSSESVITRQPKPIPKPPRKPTVRTR